MRTRTFTLADLVSNYLHWSEIIVRAISCLELHHEYAIKKQCVENKNGLADSDFRNPSFDQFSKFDPKFDHFIPYENESEWLRTATGHNALICHWFQSSPRWSNLHIILGPSNETFECVNLSSNRTQ